MFGCLVSSPAGSVEYGAADCGAARKVCKGHPAARPFRPSVSDNGTRAENRTHNPATLSYLASFGLF